MSKALILITNDDGWQAPGIQALARAIGPIAELYVVAPDGPRSGAACAITCTEPVRYRLLPADELAQAAVPEHPEAKACVKTQADADNVHWFACSGTPVDCVKLALHNILPRRPDLLLSGINAGDNASISVHYSGTMGAVLEGCMKGIPSIGLSLYLARGQRYAEHRVGADTLQAIARLCQTVVQRGLPTGVCLNINIPTDRPFRGWQVARQARGQWSAEWEPTAEEQQAQSDDPFRTHTFRLTGTFTDLEPEATDTDFAALRAGYCPVVPVGVDTTAHSAMQQLQSFIVHSESNI